MYINIISIYKYRNNSEINLTKVKHTLYGYTLLYILRFKMKKRTKISLILFIVFLISRCTDAFITWYYSHDLALEGNPFLLSITGRNWKNIAIIQILGIFFVAIYCQRLAKRDYNNPSLEEKIYNKIFNKKFSTEKKRYIHETATIFSLSIGGFIALFTWISAHEFGNQLANKFLALGGKVDIPIVLFVGWLSGKVVMRYIVNYYLKDDFST